MDIVVVTCNEYIDIVPIFEKFLVKYLKNREKFKKILCVQNIIPQSHLFDKIVEGGVNSLWTDRLQLGLKECSSTKVLLLCDDFFFSDYVEDLDMYERICEDNSLKGLRLLVSPPNYKKLEGNSLFGLYPSGMAYRISTMPTIWDRDFLLQLVKDKHWSAWDFERRGSMCLEANSGNIWVSLKWELPFVHGIIQGYWEDDAIKLFKENDLDRELYEQRKGMPFVKKTKRRVKSIIFNILLGSGMLKIQNWMRIGRNEKT